MMRTPPLQTSESSSPSVLTNIVRGWDQFWFSRTDPTTLALMRFFCGLVVFYVHLTYSWDLLSYIGPEAWVDKEVADYVQREMPVYSLPLGWGDQLTKVAQGNFYWSIFYHITDPAWIVFLHVFFLTCMLLFALGLFTRVTAALSWLGAMCYVQRASSTVFGLDTMMMIVLFYLNLGPSGATLSLDRWLQKWRARKAGQPIPEIEPSYSANFAIRLVQVHFCVIYLATGTSKLLGSTWWAGTALNLVVLNPSFTPMDHPLYFAIMKGLASHRFLWELTMTMGILYTLLIEIAFPFLVWDRRWRWVMVSCSVLLHAGIGVIMGLVTFSMMMMIMVLSFIPATTIRMLLDHAQEMFKSVLLRKSNASPEKVGTLILSR